MSLTDLQIKKLKPLEKRYEVADGSGLFIRVMPTGHKSWVLRYRFGSEKKPRRLTFGGYPDISLAKVHELHAKALQDIEIGIDPGQQKQEASAKYKAEPAFKDLLFEFWDKELSKSPTAKDRLRLVEKDALPLWSTRKVSSIKRRDAVLLLDEVRKRAPITANRLQGVLVRMFNFACERGILDNSPLVGMKRGKENSRARTLNDDEIRIIWNCLDLERKDIDIYVLTKLAIKTILLTGQRPGEVTGMKWKDLNGDWWTIPAAERKTREENRVPINPMLAEIIDQVKAISCDSSFVFLSPKYEEERPLTVGSLANAIRRHRVEMKIPDQFTPHDLRRTVRTKLAELGVEDIVAEKILGHKLQGVLGIYNRHSYDAEKKNALLLWEKRLSEIIGIAEPVSNIIQFEVKK